MEEHSGTPLLGRFEVLTANICEKVTNALAFLASSSLTKKLFYENDTNSDGVNSFSSLLMKMLNKLECTSLTSFSSLVQ